MDGDLWAQLWPQPHLGLQGGGFQPRLGQPHCLKLQGELFQQMMTEEVEEDSQEDHPK